jgi:Fe-S-cluster containining protein
LDPKKDDARKYEIEIVHRFAHPVAALKHKPNGECWYLDPGKGCTIWPRRPALCREFDCRVFLGLDVAPLIDKGILTREIVQAAYDLADRMQAPGKQRPRDEWKIPGKAQCRKRGKARENKDK